MQVGSPRDRPSSFRAKVRRALGVVLIVTLPQLALTLYYLDSVRGTADAVASQVELLHEVERIRNGFMRLSVPEAGVLSVAEQLRLERTLGEIADRAISVLDAYPSHVAKLRDVGATAARMIAAVREWRSALHRTETTLPSTDLVLLSRAVGAGDADVAVYRQRAEEARLALDDALFAIVVAVLDEVRAENVAAEATIAHADRNLMTLVLLAIVVIFLLILALPNALLQPIGRLTRAVRAAATGRAGARIEVPADDEIGALATAFNDTMETLRQFDSLKRDRIIEDAGKLDTLLRHAGGPAAILTPQFIVESANREFVHFFGAGVVDGGQPVPELLRRGRAELEQLLVRAREHRHEILDHPLTIGTTDDKGRRFKATVDVCRDRRARPTHLFIVLVPDAEAAVTTHQ